MEHTNDLMMAIVVGSTAFIALTPVLAGQVTKSGLKRCFKEVSYFLLGFSVVLGLLVILSAGSWLLPQSTTPVILVIGLFGAEIVIWEVLLIVFCVIEPCRALEPSKPATSSKRPRK